MRLIDADALDAKLEDIYPPPVLMREIHIRALVHASLLSENIAPTIDAEPVRQWISVKDRLPEDERFVLVCNDDGKIMVAQYISETVQWQFRYMAYDVDVWDDSEQGPVCWWMPLPVLPEPPKEVKRDD